MTYCEFNGPNFGMINKVYACNNALIILQYFKINYKIIFDKYYHSLEIEKEIYECIFFYYGD